MTEGILIAIIAGLTGSGFSSIILYLIQRKDKRREKLLEQKSAQTHMMIALGHDRIIALTDKYIKRGSITTKEKSNLICLYLPYAELGGNGDGKIAYEACMALPVISEEKAESLDNERFRTIMKGVSDDAV